MSTSLVTGPVTPEIFARIPSMTDKEALLALKAENLEAIDRIRSQLEKARANFITTGVPADPDWFRRARGAERIRGRLDQVIQQRLAELRRERRHQVQSEDHAFIAVARRRLSPAVFAEWREEAKALREAARDGGQA